MESQKNVQHTQRRVNEMAEGFCHIKTKLKKNKTIKINILPKINQNQIPNKQSIHD